MPCRCDYTVLTVGQRRTRLDYRLTNKANAPASVMVWIGVEVLPGADLPTIVPDLPQVNVFAEHIHYLAPSTILNESFLESEWTEMEQAWSDAYFPDCDATTHRRPAPYEVLIGVSLLDDSFEPTAFEFTVRIKN